MDDEKEQDEEEEEGTRVVWTVRWSPMTAETVQAKQSTCDS